MNQGSVLWFAVFVLAAGVGATLRYVLNLVLRERLVRRWPGAWMWSTVVINVTGSFSAGLVLGWSGAAADADAALVWAPVTVGFLGAYTTFGTASAETVRLWNERRWIAAFLYAASGLVLSAAAAIGGLVAGTALRG